MSLNPFLGALRRDSWVFAGRGLRGNFGHYGGRSGSSIFHDLQRFHAVRFFSGILLLIGRNAKVLFYPPPPPISASRESAPSHFRSHFCRRFRCSPPSLFRDEVALISDQFTRRTTWTPPPTLHMFGLSDTLVLPEHGRALSDLFPGANVFQHKVSQVLNHKFAAVCVFI